MNHSQWIEQLMHRFGKGLTRYATSILKDREAAKEVVQECFLNLLEEDPKKIGDQVKGWLFRECRNRSIDVWRKRRKVEPMTEAHEDAMSFSVDAIDPLSDLETRRDVSGLREELGKLSARHQEILWLKYNDGLSYKEIATILRLSPSNVGFILHEAMTKLRDATALREQTRALKEKDSKEKRSYGE